MAILEPELAILDETDSGLDIDALRIVAKGIREVRADRPHDGRRADHPLPAPARRGASPTTSTSWSSGRIVASGGMELAAQLERDGYEAFR